MTNETTQLWTDERISAKAQEVIALRHTPLGAIRRVSYEIRDDYERERADLAAIDAPQPPAQPTMTDDIKDDIGLCAAGIVLAYYRKAHDHILRDDDALNAALRVEKWLGRR